MKILVHILRLLAGLLFIASGFVKGIDPLGFAYTLEHYFTAFGIEAFQPLALPLSFAASAIEFTIGALLLLNLWMRVTASAFLAFMLFFTFLTAYNFRTNAVPDCGCFGSAIILSNKATFVKNIVILVPAVIVFLYRKKFIAWLSRPGEVAVAALSLLAALLFFAYNYRHLPMIDFTEWKIGNKLFAENPQPVKVFVTYKDSISGDQKEFLSPNFPYNDSAWMARWKFVGQRSEDPNEYYGKSLTIFDTTGNDVTASIIRNPGYQVLFTVNDLEHSNLAAMQKINRFVAEAANHQVDVAVITFGSNSMIARYAGQHQFVLPFYTADDVVLKTMVRSNPGMMLLKNGVIVGKWHYRDMPSFSEFSQKFPR